MAGGWPYSLQQGDTKCIQNSDGGKLLESSLTVSLRLKLEMDGTSSDHEQWWSFILAVMKLQVLLPEGSL
jgi:hypothetical protein